MGWVPKVINPSVGIHMILYAHYVWIPTTGWMAIALAHMGACWKWGIAIFMGKNTYPWHVGLLYVGTGSNDLRGHVDPFGGWFVLIPPTSSSWPNSHLQARRLPYPFCPFTSLCLDTLKTKSEGLRSSGHSRGFSPHWVEACAPFRAAKFPESAWLWNIFFSSRNTSLPIDIILSQWHLVSPCLMPKTNAGLGERSRRQKTSIDLSSISVFVRGQLLGRVIGSDGMGHDGVWQEFQSKHPYNYFDTVWR